MKGCTQSGPSCLCVCVCVQVPVVHHGEPCSVCAEERTKGTKYWEGQMKRLRQSRPLNHADLRQHNAACFARNKTKEKRKEKKKVLVTRVQTDRWMGSNVRHLM